MSKTTTIEDRLAGLPRGKALLYVPGRGFVEIADPRGEPVPLWPTKKGERYGDGTAAT